MGRIINKIKEDNKNEIFIMNIQILILEALDLLFQQNDISNVQIEHTIGIGERGDYENEENHLLKISLNYTDFYVFEFYLYYDQLEYYIYKNSKIVGKCNLEDYTTNEDEMAYTFIKYLRKDLSKLKIPFNN